MRVLLDGNSILNTCLLGGRDEEFGFFVDHFTFFAGLLFAAVHGPGDKLVWRIPRR